MTSIARSRPGVFAVFCLAAALVFPFPAAAAPGQQDLQKDLAHYRRLSGKQNLKPNDRLYILHRLESKYAGRGLDTSQLEAEIRRCREAKTEAPPPAAAEEAPPAGPAAGASLTRMALAGEGGQVKLLLDLTADVVPQAMRVDDPASPGRPALLLDLPGAVDARPEAERSLSWASGPLSSASAEEGGGKLRVRLELRGEPPFKVVRSGRRITVELGPGEAPSPAASVSPPAPAAPPAPAKPGAYAVQPGDLLNIQVSPAKELSREILVQPDGTIVFPLVGTLSVKGLGLTDLEGALTEKLRVYVTRPKVEITVKEFSNRNVFVMGKVVRPGPVPFKSGLGVLGAVSEAGGFSDEADRSSLKLYRGRDAQRKTFSVNAQEILAGGDLSKDFPLEAGDIIEVQRGGNNLSILGHLTHPGTYPFKEGHTLLQLVSDAGGLLPGAKAAHVRVYRQVQGKRQAVRVNLNRVMNGHPEEDPPLQPGDIVMVPQKPLYSGGYMAQNTLLPWFYMLSLIITIILVT